MGTKTFVPFGRKTWRKDSRAWIACATLRTSAYDAFGRAERAGFRGIKCVRGVDVCVARCVARRSVVFASVRMTCCNRVVAALGLLSLTFVKILTAWIIIRDERARADEGRRCVVFKT